MALTQRDRDTLTPAQQAQIQAYTDQWNSATTDAERAAANAGANAVRAQAGYSGGDNGVTYRAPNTYEAADAYWMTHASPQQPSYGGDSLAAQYQSLFNAQNSAYEQALAAQKAANEAAVQKAVNSLEQQKTDTNSAYSDYYRQAYIDKMNAQKNIDQRLAAQGITGGAAESTLLGLNTSYADALRQMEQGRIRDLEGLDRAITDARLTGDIEGANAAANAIREQTASYSDTLKYLLDQAEAQNARQTAYDREDAATSRAWAQQLALNALNNGYMPDGDTLTTANMSTDYAAALLDAINRQKAQEQADWRAGYGDYSALADLGVDTGNLTAQQALQLAAMRRQGTTNSTSSTPRYTQAQAEMALRAALNGDYSGQNVVEGYYNMPIQSIIGLFNQTPMSSSEAILEATSKEQTQTGQLQYLNSLFEQGRITKDQRDDIAYSILNPGK